MNTPAKVRAFWAALHDPEQYVKVEDVPVFDSHEETYYIDEDGKPCKPDAKGAKAIKRKFDKEHLEHLAKVNNSRFHRGEVTGLTFGHTDPKEKDETKQPPLRGYAANYHVGKDDEGRHLLLVNYYIKKEDFSEAKTYPRTSIELWPGDWAVDPIALLRRTPARPIPQWTFSASEAGKEWAYFQRGDGKEVLQYSRDNALYFERDQPMADMPPLPPRDEEEPGMGEGAPTPEEHDSYMKHCASHHAHKGIHEHYAKHAHLPHHEAPPHPHDELHQYMHHAAQHKHHAKIHAHYAKHAGGEEPVIPEDKDKKKEKKDEKKKPEQNAAFASPSSTNTSMPQSQFARDMDNLRFAKMEQRMAALEQQNADLLKEREEAKKEASLSESQRLVSQLYNEGYFNFTDPREAEEEALAFSKLSAEEREARVKWIRKHSTPAPVDRSAPSQYGRVGQVPVVVDRRNTEADKIDYVREPEAIPRTDRQQIDAHISVQKIPMPVGDPMEFNRKYMAVAAQLMPQKYGKYAQQGAPALNGAR